MARTKQIHKVRTVDNLDVTKIKQYFLDHNIHHTVISKEMGYDATYMSKVFKRDIKMAYTAYKMMCLMLKVDEDTFILKETVATPKEEQPKTKVIMGSGVSTEQFDKMLNSMNDLIAVGDRIADTLTALVDALGVPHKTVEESSNTTIPNGHLKVDIKDKQNGR